MIIGLVILAMIVIFIVFRKATPSSAQSVVPLSVPLLVVPSAPSVVPSKPSAPSIVLSKPSTPSVVLSTPSTPSVVLSAPSPTRPSLYYSPYSTNGKDGCIKYKGDGTCQTTACQIDVLRACMSSVSRTSSRDEYNTKLEECKHDTSRQCLGSNGGNRPFDCNIDPGLCSLAEARLLFRYDSPYATNGKDGCIKIVPYSETGACMATACQVDVARACSKSSSNVEECRQRLGNQCSSGAGATGFRCSSDPELCAYATNYSLGTVSK